MFGGQESRERADGIDVEELRDEVLIPAPRSPAPMPRVVGPGRLERGYRARIESLEEDIARRARALECAALVERGQTRLLDRLETEIERARGEVAELEQREKRLILGLGALQRENELLRASERRATRLGSARAQVGTARSSARTPARSWWSRITARIGGASARARDDDA